MPIAVIFDFDGVLADTEKLHFKAFNVVLKEHGIELMQDKYWQDYLGYTDQECFEAVSRDYSTPFNQAAIDELIRKKAVEFDRLVKQDGAIIDGVMDFITLLEKNKIPISICSGALMSDIDSVLSASVEVLGRDLRNSFEVIITADNVKKGKPHPEGYLLTLERINRKLNMTFNAEDCIVIEDSHWGLEAAKAAGMNSIAVTNSYSAKSLQGKADLVVDNLKSLTLDDLLKVSQVCEH